MTGGAHRKVVTVLFCDVVGSTALGESADPEALQSLLARYFERMKTIVESHGGTVEKFIGDAVMAVFGVPVAHEDDALRACRAAVEMRDALPELGVEGRIGVNTGEVLAGTEERLATGDAVNVAARLEQAAEPGEVLIGAETLALALNAVDVGNELQLELKGKSEPVAAHPLVSIREAPERSHTSRFVGRERELQQLAEAWESALAGPRCELVTIVGDPGVGKTRLVAEALAGIETRVVRGRCLPYGEGITYWPVVEIVKQLDALPSDEEAAGVLRSLLGESERPTSPDEIAWAFRKLLEEQAPLVVSLDDLQWSEETFLDLVESTALLSGGAPLLLLCMARPELLEQRPTWSPALVLEPLPPEEADLLVGAGLPPGFRERIIRAAGGNPLFITEMLALATVDGELEVPPTLRALIAARLDQLAPDERSVIERGAVEGEIFHRGAVQALAPEEREVLPKLAALVRHELIRPDRPQFPGEDAFRFRHLLIRDAAYEALPKSVRAEFHCRLADWLAEDHDLVELDEVVGFHLEQAVGYRVELGKTDQGLALGAGDRLIAAARRAIDRHDGSAAIALFERGLSLTRPFRVDLYAELDLAEQFLNDPVRAKAVCDSAAVQADAAGDETGAALARAMAALYGAVAGPVTVDELEALLLAVRPRLEEAEDHAGLAQVWWALGFGVANGRGRADDWVNAALRAHRHRQLAGRLVLPSGDLGPALIAGSTPADEALEILDRHVAESSTTDWLLLNRAWLLAMLERHEEVQGTVRLALSRVRDADDFVWGEWQLGEIAALGGDYDEETSRLFRLVDWLEETGQLSYLPLFLARLARSLCNLGRFDEAEQILERSRAVAEELEGPGGEKFYLWSEVEARVQASRGRAAEAERLAREAVALSEDGDRLTDRCIAWWALGDVLASAGRMEEARAALEDALECAEQKRNLALGRQLRERLAALELA